MSSIWVADVTYIQMPGGSYLYLGTIFDPETRTVLVQFVMVNSSRNFG
ncbi:hypothetical protein ACOWO9_09590 [Leuconostoc mesenteroides]